jgi:hypothetical protein
VKFIDTSTYCDSLYHHTMFLLGKKASPPSAVDTTSYPPRNWMRSAMTYYRKAAYYIWKNTAGWEFDDSNYTTLPIATTTLVDGQQDYSIPTNALDIQRVEVAASDGSYKLLNRTNKEEIQDSSLTSYYSTNGLPRYYDVIGNSIFLYPAPAAANVTLSAGLKLYLSRDVYTTNLTIPDSYQQRTTEPGFHIDFHPFVAIGAALDYGVSNNYTKDKMDNLKALYQEYLTNIEYYYSRRDRDYPTKIRVSPRSSV